MFARQNTEASAHAADVIAKGGLIAFRTDTFYGLGVDPFNVEAIRKLKQLKGREDHKPILIVISDLDQVGRFINQQSAAFDFLAKELWPGPLTLIGRAGIDVPHEITAGTQTVGVRLPQDDQVRALVRACGGALTATSANPSNMAPASNAQMVREYFGEAVDLILDDGDARTSHPSTVVDVSGVEPALVREGVVAWAEIDNLLRQRETVN